MPRASLPALPTQREVLEKLSGLTDESIDEGRARVLSDPDLQRWLGDDLRLPEGDDAHALSRARGVALMSTAGAAASVEGRALEHLVLLSARAVPAGPRMVPGGVLADIRKTIPRSHRLEILMGTPVLAGQWIEVLADPDNRRLPLEISRGGRGVAIRFVGRREPEVLIQALDDQVPLHQVGAVDGLDDPDDLPVSVCDAQAGLASVLLRRLPRLTKRGMRLEGVDVWTGGACHCHRDGNPQRCVDGSGALVLSLLGGPFQEPGKPDAFLRDRLFPFGEAQTRDDGGLTRPEDGTARWRVRFGVYGAATTAAAPLLVRDETYLREANPSR